MAHEIDHLHGILCQDHLPLRGQPIPVEQYRGTGVGWEYYDPGSVWHLTELQDSYTRPAFLAAAAHGQDYEQR